MSLLSSLATGSQLSLRLQLSRTVRVLHLGLSKDDVAVASGGLVDFGAGDDEEDVAGSSEGDSLDALDALETETFESLPGLALGAGVELDGGAGGDFGLVRDVEVLDGHGGCVCGWGLFQKRASNKRYSTARWVKRKKGQFGVMWHLRLCNTTWYSGGAAR